MALPLLCSARGRAESAETQDPFDTGDSRYPAYLSLVDGLHVTGTPIEVDAGTYRLRVNGRVQKPLSLNLDEVRALPRQRLSFALECPGFFTDQGFWTGVPLKDLLALAGYDRDAAAVELTSIDGSYSQLVSLDTVLTGNVLVAYQFDDRDFAVYHGFPLRIAAEGEPGSVWVKWLGSITVQ